MSVLTERLAPGDRILLDSSVLAAYLDGGEAASPVAVELLDELVRSGRNPAVVSMVSVMETLIRPLRRLPAAHATVLAFYREFPHLVAAPVDLDVAAEAANLRVVFGLAAPDALIAATGLAGGVAHLVTNDRAWAARLAPLRSRTGVLVLGDLGGTAAERVGTPAERPATPADLGGRPQPAAVRRRGTGGRSPGTGGAGPGRSR